MLPERAILYGAILPSGGRGERLRSLTEDKIPKSLYPVGGKELIQYSIENLSPEVVERIVFAVDHHADLMKEWVAKKSLPYLLHFSEQLEPGVLGAITAASAHIQEEVFIACNTDEIRIGLDIEEMLRLHRASGTLATMATTYTNRLHQHRLITIRESDNRIIDTRLKSEEYLKQPEKIGLVNTGFLIIEKRAMDYFDPQYNTDWGGIIDPLVDAGQLTAYIDRRILYFNVGTVDEFNEAHNALGYNSAYS